ncbi:MAG: NUDIX domain-containing protein [Terracidiphilus sp.]|jgi:predicted NUDIX family NTP pyrophosphohydrolase
MPKMSAGIVLYRWRVGLLQVFLVHPGGPFWKNKDAGAWSIPKGEYSDGEGALPAARREFFEETGFALPAGEFNPLGEIRQPSGKVISAWAIEGDIAAEEVKSNLFSLEWPPKSGKIQEFPEVDRACWFDLDAAREKLIEGQRGFLDRLVRLTEPREVRI